MLISVIFFCQSFGSNNSICAQRYSETSDQELSYRTPENAYLSEIMSKILDKKEVLLFHNFSHRRLR